MEATGKKKETTENPLQTIKEEIDFFINCDMDAKSMLSTLKGMEEEFLLSDNYACKERKEKGNILHDIACMKKLLGLIQNGSITT